MPDILDMTISFYAESHFASVLCLTTLGGILDGLKKRPF
jgi:hypothetical protein